MFDWNDVKFLLAVGRHGSTMAVARTLGVHQSTVQRRLAELERRLGLRLVERLPVGYRLTPIGRSLLPAVETIEHAAAGIEQAAASACSSGTLRLTCPEPVAGRLVQSGLIDRFHRRHPAFRVEFILSDRYVDLAKGEADIALRSGDTDADLVGRKVADSLWAVYVSTDYRRRRGAPSTVLDLAAHPLIAFDAGMSGHRLSLWLADVARGATYAARAGSVLGMLHAARAGVGVAALPTAIADAEPNLMRAFGPVAELTRAWRLLAHRDTRPLPKVEAFFAFVLSNRKAMAPILTGGSIPDRRNAETMPSAPVDPTPDPSFLTVS